MFKMNWMYQSRRGWWKFYYKDNWFKQVVGILIGSSITPTMNHIFINKWEQSITSFNGTLPKLYIRYVDDVFLIFRSTSDIQTFYEYMNSLHANI